MTRQSVLGHAAVTVLVLTGVALAALALPRHSATITLHPDEVHQELTGWEAGAGTADVPLAPFWADVENEMLDRVIDEIGINRVRLPIRAGAETHKGIPGKFVAGEINYARYKDLSYEIENDNDDPFVIDPAGFDFSTIDWAVRHLVLPLKARLEARGERLVINVTYVNFHRGASLHDDPEEYAEFVLATYQYLQQTFGLVPDIWEVTLEPDLVENNWTGRQIGEAMAAAARRLEAAGFHPAFVAPSVTDMDNAVPYAREIAAVPGAMDHWSELSYHRYRHASRSNLDAIAAFAAEHGLKTSMLEYWFGKGDAAVLRQDLVRGNVSAFQGRVVTGFFDIDRTGATPRLTARQDARTTALYFGAGRLGWHRIGADTDAPGSFDAVGFAAPDGRASVVIAAANAGSVTVTGLPAGSYRTRFVPEGMAEVPQVRLEVGSDPLVLRISGKGILSVSPMPPV